LESGVIRPEGLVSAIDGVLEKPDRSVEEVLTQFRVRTEDQGKLDVTVQEVAKEASDMEGRSPDILMRWAMGEVMRRFFGRVDPAVVREKLREALGKEEEGVAQ
jgi:Glu-tRNA(Gln) amidotransferase subunit E-like FAD-binding protein